MLHAEPTTVNLAFPPRKQYAIPSYQRNYVWTREGQWEPLWDDLTALTHQILKEGSDARPHFLGTIITKQIGADGFIDQWWVVDGQQRLTTLQILIAATSSAFNECGLTQCASILTNALINAPEVIRDDNPEDKYKIRHKSSDYSGFSTIIEAGLNGTENAALKELRLHDCYDYFRTTVIKWVRSTSGEARGQHATALTKAVLDKLQVVDIRLLDARVNSHAIFEALNARGKPLTEWEKTKNYILSIAVRNDDPDGDRTYTKHLEEYDSDPYWDQTVKVQRFAGKRIDLFLFFFAQIELPKRRRRLSEEAEPQPLKRESLYREFRYVGEHLYRANDEELGGLLRRLGRYASIYRQIDRKDNVRFSEYARLVMERRSALKLNSLMPVLMVLVDRLGYGKSLDQALRVVDSYLMRRVARKANYSGFDDVAFRYVQAIRDAPSDDVIAVLIDQLEKAPWASRWPADDELLLHMREANMYHRNAHKQLLLLGVAQRIHEEKEGDLTMPFGAKSGLTVEHVAPQDWERHWGEDLDFGDNDEDRQRLNRLVNRIGNLTLVTRKLNPKLGNRPWSYKAELLEKDNLQMNRRLLEDMEGETWSEAEINRRGQKIADYVREIWPHAAALRRELGVPPVEADGLVSGFSPLIAERLVDSVSDSGVEDGWADTEGVNRWRRDGRYGRHLYLGGGDRWQGVWFGVSPKDHQFMVEYWDPEVSPHRFIAIPDNESFDEQLESVTTQVREIAEAVAGGL